MVAVCWRAREVFAAEKKRRPRGHYTQRQGIRVPKSLAAGLNC